MAYPTFQTDLDIILLEIKKRGRSLYVVRNEMHACMHGEKEIKEKEYLTCNCMHAQVASCSEYP
jgi:hypothetical protein